MLSLRQLRYFAALADVLHFRKAAERCHVTQPALTTQIQALEATLGVQQEQFLVAVEGSG